MHMKEWSGILLLLVTLLIGLSAYGAESAETKLKILVYGATGKVGTHVVTEALQRGHAVLAVSRYQRFRLIIR